MYHYVALVWNAEDSGAREAAAHLTQQFRESSRRWLCPLSAVGITVFVEPGQVRTFQSYGLPRDCGVILGRLFPKDLNASQPTWDATFDEHSALHLVRTGGRSLLETHWGNYIAFLRDPENSRCCVIRDCSARIPCYRTQYSRVHIVFSDIVDLHPLNLPPFQINRNYVAAFIYTPELRIRECGLTNVTEILAGECFELRLASERQFPIWDPGRICETACVEDYDQAKERLLSTTQRCIDAWSSVCDSVVLNLSGGLDSAIVLGCLCKSPTRASVTCANIFSDIEVESDERPYARLAAARADATLIELCLDSPDPPFNSSLVELLKTVKPSIVNLYSALRIEATNAISAGVTADTVWTGEGGDHLFLENKTVLSAADYISRYGINLGLPTAIADAARLTRTPYVSVLRTAWSLARTRAPWKPHHEGSQREAHLVSAESLPENTADYIAHPWDASVAGIPKGKQSQIYYLADVLHRHRPLPRREYAYQQHPLLSQPLMELCLQIPTYLLLRGGRQRSLARDTFRDCVPVEILQREDKGGLTFAILDQVRQSEAFIRDIFTNGILSQMQIVNPRVLERYIARGESVRLTHCRQLLACITAELWARSWYDTAMAAAA